MNCHRCQKEINPRRIKALPHTKVCVNCSSEGRIAGFALITGKTEYSQLQLVPQEVAETLHKKQQRYGQSPGQGMKGKA